MRLTSIDTAQAALFNVVLDTLVASGGTLTYAAVALIIGLSSPQDPKLTKLLDESMRDDDDLSGIRAGLIVSKKTQRPSPAFYDKILGADSSEGERENFFQENIKTLRGRAIRWEE